MALGARATGPGARMRPSRGRPAERNRLPLPARRTPGRAVRSPRPRPPAGTRPAADGPQCPLPRAKGHTAPRRPPALPVA